MSLGPRLGPVRGPLLGPRLAHPPAGPTSTIYDQTTAADLNTYLQTLLGSAADFTCSALWPANQTIVGSPAFPELVAGNDLDGQAGALTVASPHGVGVGQSPAAEWWAIADNAALDAGVQAVAILAHVNVSAAPAASLAYIGKGSPASGSYLGGIDAAGQPYARCKRFGPPTIATVATSVVGASYFWTIPVARSITGGSILCAIDGASTSAAFPAATDLGNVLDPFAVANFNTGGPSSTCEWGAVFFGTAAENIIANQAALLTALEAAE